MTLEEKLAQLVGFWVDQGDEVVAPMAGEMATRQRHSTSATAHGIGHLTRVYGTRPVDAGRAGARGSGPSSAGWSRETRLGIPAIVHEECLTGLAAWKAATFPTPLAWGASFDPELVEEMGARHRRRRCATLGIHQGLAPVLDVIRDPRWGRVDECIAEDPYVVGTIGTAYVRGLQAPGVHATLKHFVGYSALAGGPQPRAGARRPARGRGRAAAAVRDGDPRRRRALGHELLHRDRRRARRRPTRAS